MGNITKNKNDYREYLNYFYKDKNDNYSFQNCTFFSTKISKEKLIEEYYDKLKNNNDISQKYKDYAKLNTKFRMVYLPKGQVSCDIFYDKYTQDFKWVSDSYGDFKQYYDVFEGRVSAGTLKDIFIDDLLNNIDINCEIDICERQSNIDVLLNINMIDGTYDYLLTQEKNRWIEKYGSSYDEVRNKQVHIDFYPILLALCEYNDEKYFSYINACNLTLYIGGEYSALYIFNKRLELARDGDAIEQFNVAYAYSMGKLVPKDIKKAIYWYEKSASQDYASAQNNLGNKYCNGDGVDVDYNKAFDLFTKACKEDNPIYQCNLASCYLNGQGTEKNYSKALYWSSKAEKNGSEKAKVWLEEECNTTDSEKQNLLGSFYINNSEFGKINKAIELLKKSNNQGNEQAALNLGVLYYLGKNGCLKDEKLALEYFNKAFKMNNYHSCYYLGCCYKNGIGTNVDKQKAFDFYKKATLVNDENTSQSSFYLAQMYEKGIGTPVNEALAINYYFKALEYGMEKVIIILEKKSKKKNPYLLFNLYNYYIDEFDFEEKNKNDIKKAINYLKLSAKKKYGLALIALAKNYEEGKNGVKKNYSKAVYYYKKALKVKDKNNDNTTLEIAKERLSQFKKTKFGWRIIESKPKSSNSNHLPFFAE